MAKAKTAYVCSDCGAEYSKWAGQCTECGAWNVLAEVRLEKPNSGSFQGYAGKAGEAVPVLVLAAVSAAEEVRLSTHNGELDRVLGGGLVKGSVVLIGGEPGIGKSTLLLQVLASIAAEHSAIYVTGEESLGQVASRARRLGLPTANLAAMADTRIERIVQSALQRQPEVLVIDSIQTMYTDALTAAPGSVSQVRDCAARLTRFAKDTGTSVFLVGHVTKEGGIAGPRVLEHMVDAVLYFEGESGSRFRLLRAFKNRFGAVNELGVFAMGDRGLKEVPNPSAIFLSGNASPAAGSIIMVTREGTRPLLVEVQALVDQSPLANPRRVTLGLEQNRLAMLLAVLHKHGGIALYDQDVFVNIVGGIRVQETAADLPVLLAVLSSFRNRALAEHSVAFGEVGLGGEIRPVPNGEERLREASHQGLKRIILPKANAPKRPPAGIEVIAVERLSEAIDAVRDA
ncbi:MAG: DNA repair protein RadA [Lysobacterales bacterium CG02_land_8_20_14_3_00_62_12]|nr:MAG: DNA repair protein RadA [Xanthomonadales bacterium CG02_land_8_20_14_3_00_62_12]